jgi:hypothetical protein
LRSQNEYRSDVLNRYDFLFDPGDEIGYTHRPSKSVWKSEKSGTVKKELDRGRPVSIVKGFLQARKAARKKLEV